jgi:hypothetical protein
VSGRVLSAGFCDLTAAVGQALIEIDAEQIPGDVTRFWLIDAGQLREMTAQEKAATIATEEDQKKDLSRIDKLILAALLVLAERSGLTLVQFRAAVKAKIDQM